MASLRGVATEVYERPLGYQEAKRNREEEAALAEAEKRRAAQQKKSEEYTKSVAEDEKMRAAVGTTDPVRGTEIAALLGGDIKERMAIDPEGTQAQIQRAAELSGRTGVGAMGGSGRTYSVGTGSRGEQYFTNLTREELHKEQRRREEITGNKEAPVRGLTTLGMRDTGGGAAGGEPPRDAADIMFKQRLDSALATAGVPDRALANEAKRQKYVKDLFDKSPDINTARDTLQKQLFSGELKGKFTPQDIHVIDTLLVRSAVKPGQQNPDPTRFKPWKARDKAGIAADKSEPASVLNPGGGMTEQEVANGRQQLVAAEHASALEAGAPKELPRTFQYAQRGVQSDTAKRLREKARKRKLSRAQEPANPRMGRLEEDRRREIGEAQLGVDELFGRVSR